MKKYLLLILTILFVSTTTVYSQGEAAVPFLQIHPGPNLNAMAGAFTALPSSDAFGQYFNPAQLGNFGREKNFSFQFFPNKINWLPAFNYSDLTFRSSAFALGYNFKSIFPKIPISIGLGYLDTELDLGQNIHTDDEGNYLGSYHSMENYTAYSFAIGVDYFVRFNIGYTFKKIHSDLGLHDVKVDAEDIGIQLTLPIINTIDIFTEKPILFSDGSIPFFDISIGLAQSNNGEKVKYIDLSQSYPLPKQAKIGYAISFGLAKEYKSFNFQLIKFDWSSEARDRLIKTDEYGKKDYVKFPGEVEIWDNVLLGKSDEQVTVYQGWRIKLLDTFQYSQGRYTGPGFPTFQRTHGFLFSSTGILKWLSVNHNSNILKFAVNHFELSYIGTRYTSDSPLNDTEFEAISFSIFGF